MFIENNPEWRNVFLNSLETVGGDSVIHRRGCEVVNMNVTNLVEVGENMRVVDR